MFAVLMSTLLMAAIDPTPAAATPAPPSAAAAVASQAAQKPKTTDVTCWEERPTGSHVSKRVCASREQIDKAQRDGEDATVSRNRGPQNTFRPS